MSTPLKTGCYDGDNFDLPVNLQTTKELNQLGTRSFKFIVKLFQICNPTIEFNDVVAP
tara:strand:+ start:971 stop:1144 length:174 start_codon:yes stop_codon:yes gene_type:complete